MTAKEHMKQAKILLRRIDRKRKEANNLRKKLSVPQSPDFSDMPKTASPEPNEIEIGVAKIISLEEEVRVAEMELEKLKGDFKMAILAITDTEYHDILTKRYLEFKDWSIVADEMGYSEPSCYRLHREALALMKS
ncbi:MAG: hypothetical protein NC177_16065 [Ruminococcus flavefaciens]|nr:hypothetical protein [Ruminococcus flavefaciens]